MHPESYRIGLIICLLFCNMAALRAAQINQAAPEFSLPTIEVGNLIHTKDYRGKVVYLDFWASWCVPCRASFPLLNDLYLQYKEQGLEVVAINLDEDESLLNKFQQRYPVAFTLLRDKESQTPEQYQVQAMPSSYIIDKKGTIRFIHRGFKKSDIGEIEKQVSLLLKE